jgi:hypothetical protein
MCSQKKASTILIQFAYKLATIPIPPKYRRQIFKSLMLITVGKTRGVGKKKKINSAFKKGISTIVSGKYGYCSKNAHHFSV